MRTAVDSNILIDLIAPDSPFAESSARALDSARLQGALCLCPVVVAEISAHFNTAKELAEALRAMQLPVEELHIEALHAAGTAFARYRQRSSKPKDRMLADFLIGAHALHRADALLTRDRGYYRTYFPKLRVIHVAD